MFAHSLCEKHMFFIRFWSCFSLDVLGSDETNRRDYADRRAVVVARLGQTERSNSGEPPTAESRRRPSTTCRTLPVTTPVAQTFSRRATSRQPPGASMMGTKWVFVTSPNYAVALYRWNLRQSGEAAELAKSGSAQACCLRETATQPTMTRVIAKADRLRHFHAHSVLEGQRLLSCRLE